MKTLRIALALVLGLCLAGPLWAAPKAKAEKAPPCPATQQVNKIVKKLNLSDDQTAKLDALKKEYGPKLAAARKQAEEAKKRAAEVQKENAELAKGLEEKIMALLTAEQKAQIEPKKAEGKKGEGKKADAKKADGKKAECKKNAAKKADAKKGECKKAETKKAEAVTAAPAK